MEATIGRIVHYHTTDDQRLKMRNDRCNESELLPAIIVAVWSPTLVNLKVILDGEGEWWITSAQEGTLDGQWEWPVIKPEAPAGDAKVS